MTSSNPSRRDVISVGVAGLAAAALSGSALAQDAAKTAPAAAATPQAGAYAARDYSGLLGGVTGLSDDLLKQHFTLYQGYVKNTNSAIAALGDHAKAGTVDAPPAAELRRRFGWEFNGMRLHELYFENMGGKTPLAADSKLGKAIATTFGSVDAWAAEFKGVGKMRGIGWVALVQDGWTGRLFNTWINEHDGGHLGACPIVLIMDVFEHAYITQYGLKKADYIEAFMKTINWEAAAKRV